MATGVSLPTVGYFFPEIDRTEPDAFASCKQWENDGKAGKGVEVHDSSF